MSLLGKILAVLNIFGVAGFFVLAVLDYSKRQAWSYAVFRQDLALQGLPLDANDRDPEGRPLVELIGENTKKDLYKGQQGPATQEEEVKRFQADLQNRLRTTGGGAKQTADEAYLLLPFAQTNAQRERLLAYRYWLGSDKNTPAQLKQFFLQAEEEAKRPLPADQEKKSFRERFTEALAAREVPMAEPFVELLFATLAADPAKTVGPAFDQSLETLRTQLDGQVNQLFATALNTNPEVKQSADMRRRNIARVLFNLADPLYVEGAAQPAVGALLDNPVYLRLFTVVGVRQAIQTINDQARDLASIALELDTERGRDRTLFALNHQKLIEQIREKVAQLDADKALLKRKNEQVVVHEEELKKRRRDVKQFEDDLAEARRVTAEKLKELRTMSDALLKVRLEVRQATEQNQKLEKEIRGLEDTTAPRGSGSGR